MAKQLGTLIREAQQQVSFRKSEIDDIPRKMGIYVRKDWVAERARLDAELAEAQAEVARLKAIRLATTGR